MSNSKLTVVATKGEFDICTSQTGLDCFCSDTVPRTIVWSDACVKFMDASDNCVIHDRDRIWMVGDHKAAVPTYQDMRIIIKELGITSGIYLLSDEMRCLHAVDVVTGVVHTLQPNTFLKVFPIVYRKRAPRTAPMVVDTKTGDTYHIIDSAKNYTTNVDVYILENVTTKEHVVVSKTLLESDNFRNW